jgi:hypothetical protein
MAKFFRPLVLALLLLGTVVDMSAVFGGPGPVYYSL